LTKVSVFLKMRYKPVWRILEEVRIKTFESLKDMDLKIAEESRLVASELFENAIKYGDYPKGGKYIDFEFKHEDGSLIMLVSNLFSSTDKVEKVIEKIDEINKTDDPEILFKNRLVELTKNCEKGESKLGLYRIVYETKYKLNYKINKNVITIIAQRSI
jgi:hypothetical protein